MALSANSLQMRYQFNKKVKKDVFRLYSTKEIKGSKKQEKPSLYIFWLFSPQKY